MGTGRNNEGEVSSTYATPSDVQFFAERGFAHSGPTTETLWESFVRAVQPTGAAVLAGHCYVYHSGDGWRRTPEVHKTEAKPRLFHTPIEAWIDAEGHAWTL